MSIKLTGSTSGSIEVDVPAAVSGGDISLTLPNGVGSAEQFLKNSGTAGELEYSSMVETSTGVGIGTSSPAVKAHISNGYTAPTGGFDGNIFLAVTNNSSSSNAAGIALSAGATGAAFIHFGDTDDANVASVVYDNDDNSMRFTTNASERLRISSTGVLTAMGVYNNVTGTTNYVSVTTSGLLLRSTSSAKYKQDIETLEDSYADALLNVRPVWYRSASEFDNQDHSFWGFIAEEVAEIDPRLVHWKTVEVTYDENGSAVETPCDPEPEGVAYDRFVPHLLNLIKRQKSAIETLETQNTAQQTQIDDLLARVTALEAA